MIVRVLCFFFCILPVLAFSAETPNESAKPAAGAALIEMKTSLPRTVVVFGDSITEGGSLPKNQSGQTWLRMVEQETNGVLKMLNEGKGGRATQSVSEFEAMLSRQPHIDQLVIALGTNDSRDITPGCVPKAVSNVRKMIEKARAVHGPALSVLLVGPPNINKSALGPTKSIGDQREAKLRELGDAYAALAKELGCEFVSLFGVVPDASLSRDGVHPDAVGNAAIARVIHGKLEP